MIFRARNCIFLLLVASFVVADEPSKPNEKAASESNAVVKDPQPTPAPSNVTTTEAPKPPTTTQAPTTKPTPPPTPKPEPTTTTTQSPPTTSTPAPTTTAKPTPSPTPSPAPTTPKPSPARENWIVPGPNGTVCIVANMAIQIHVPYKSTENKTVESVFRVDHVENATATGTCDGNTESLVLNWKNVSATFNFALNTTAFTYSLDSVNIVIGVDNSTFPNNTMTNVTELHLVYNGSLFSVPLNNSYTCATVAPLSLNGTTTPTTNATVPGKLTVANVHVQAFGKKNETTFRTSMDCASSETPDIVPIVVGLVLAGLVVVVLVAYLVGRRRAQSRGYLSM